MNYPILDILLYLKVIVMPTGYQALKTPNPQSGYIFILGGGVVSCKSFKQTCTIVRSTIEYEFIALDKVGEEAE